jgi:hypothetical protein
MALDLGREPDFVGGPGLEPAFALEHLVHDSSRRP